MIPPLGPVRHALHAPGKGRHPESVRENGGRFVFALYLHTRIVMGWKGRRSALIAIIGFLAAMFTYFGVNYLLSGLHSYA